MKKSLQIIIIILGAILFLAGVLIYGLLYFNPLHENLRPITDSEKDIVISVLNDSSIPQGYEIKFGKVFSAKDKEIAQISILRDNSKEDYFIDLRGREIIKH